jgi:hypothetical protein
VSNVPLRHDTDEAIGVSMAALVAALNDAKVEPEV